MNTDGTLDPDHYKKVIEDALQKMESVSPVTPPSPIEDDVIRRRIQAEQVVHIVVTQEGLPPEGVMALLEWRTRVSATVAKMQVTLPTNERFDLNHALSCAERLTTELIAEMQCRRTQAHVDLERAKTLSVEREAEAKRLLAEAVRAPYARPLGALRGLSMGLHDVSHVGGPTWVKLLVVAAQSGVGAITGDTREGSPAVTPSSHRLGE